MSTLAAHQTQYIPYPGLFNKLFDCDVFVFQDDVQYVKQEFQNRNRIRTPDGWKWLTLPVHYKSHHAIAEIYPAEPFWEKRHQRIVQMYYGKSSYIDRMKNFWKITEAHKEASLSVIAFETTCYLAALISRYRYNNIRIILESELNLTKEETSTPTNRLITLCKKLGCDRYISGMGGAAYLNIPAWQEHGIELSWQKYQPKRYKQLYEGWVPNLSIIDLLLNTEDPFEYL